MKLLFVTPFVPYPPMVGTSMIVLNQIRNLALRHTVDLICFKNRYNPAEVGDLRSVCNEVELVTRQPRWRMLLRVFAGLWRYIPFRVLAVRSAEMSSAINRRLSGKTYDAVIFVVNETGQFLPDWFRGASIWSLEDPMILKEKRMLSMRPWYVKPWIWDKIIREMRYESSQVPKFDCVLFVNEEDSRDYRGVMPGAETDWVPSGIDGLAFCPSEEVPRSHGMIVMTGNMYHKPNVDAVDYFCKEIFPLVCKEVGTASLWLVGARPAAAVRKWARNSRIRVTGFVPDLRTYLRQAVVSVSPIRLRIGTQTKILEALACGTPVVTSSAGNHGIHGISGEHLYVADDPSEFANRVVSLLRGERWSELSQNGRRFVLENFTWEKSTARLEDIIERCAARKPAALLWR